MLPTKTIKLRNTVDHIIIATGARSRITKLTPRWCKSYYRKAMTLAKKDQTKIDDYCWFWSDWS
jgi:hypothetical protein